VGARSKSSSRLIVLVALAAVYLIWGSTYLGIRVAIEGFPPSMMVAIRMFFAGCGLYLVLRLCGRPAPTLLEWRNTAIVGALMLLGGQGAVTFAEQTVSSGLTALAVGAMPLWAALFSGLWGHWPGRIEVLGLAVGFSGLMILNLGGAMSASPIGALLLLFSPASWALGSVLSRHLRLPSGLMASAAEMMWACVLFTAVSLLRGERLHAFPSGHAVFALAYLVVLGSVVAFSAYLFLLSHVRPVLATSYAYVNPVVALAVGVWLGGEHISGAALIATPIILGGVVIVMLGGQRTRRATT
jgi:drug/metabolite transporter (DMT)-like permease